MKPLAAWMNTGAKAAGTGLSFLLLLFLARAMTPEEFARAALVLAWLALGTVLASLSMPFLVLRFIAGHLAEERPGAARGIAGFALATAGLAAAALALGTELALRSGAWHLEPPVATAARVGALMLVPGALLLVTSGILQGIKHVVAAEILANVARPAVVLAVLAAIWLAHREPLPATTVLLAYLGATVAALVASGAWALAKAPGVLRAARAEYLPRLWVPSGLAFLAVMVTAALNERLDLVLLGALAPAGEVAVYAVAARFFQTVTAVLTAVTTVMAPHLVESLAGPTGPRRAEATAIARRTGRTAAIIAGASFVFFLLAGPLVLSAFGEHYQAAYGPVLVLTGGLAVASLFGPATPAATFGGAPSIAVGSLAAGIVANALLNVTLVPRLGATGAAVATAAGTLLTAALAWAWTRRRLGLDTLIFGATGAVAARGEGPVEADPAATPARRLKHFIALPLIPPARLYIRYAPLRAGKRALWEGFVGPRLSWRRYRASARTVFGKRFRCDTRSLVQRYIYYFGIWEPHLTRWMQSRLAPGDTMVDIGANVGYYSILGSGLVGERGRVVAIEASPEIYGDLMKNLSDNGVANVRTVNVAVADRPGRLRLFPGDALTTVSEAWAQEMNLRPGPWVEALPLDQILTPQELREARVIKIDVEGAEWPVVQGMAGILGELPERAEIVIEVTPVAIHAYGKSGADLVREFEKHGFHPYRIPNDYSHRDYLAAVAAARPRRHRGAIEEQMDLVFSRTDAEVL